MSAREKLQEQLNKMDKKNQNLIKNLIIAKLLIDVALPFIDLLFENIESIILPKLHGPKNVNQKYLLDSCHHFGTVVVSVCFGLKTLIFLLSSKQDHWTRYYRYNV